MAKQIKKSNAKKNKKTASNGVAHNQATFNNKNINAKKIIKATKKAAIVC